MPRLAEKYYYREYSSIQRNYDFSHKYNNVTNLSSVKRKKNRKRNPLRFAISCGILLFILGCVMPYSCGAFTNNVFNPFPYKNIKTDMHEMAFPSTKYLSNALFLNQRSFRFAASDKTAQMLKLKENVNMPSLKAELLNLMEQYPTVKPAIYVWDYETQNYVDINADKIYATASIIKIPVLIDLFKSIEAGQISLEDTMPLTEYYRTEGSGSLQFKARNSQWSIDELARVMITESDNSATNMLMSKVGSMTDVNQSMRNWGLSNTEVVAWLPDLEGQNRTTAREMATMLYNIDSNDKFLSENSKQKIFDYMGHVHNDRLIQAGLGQGSVFLHKTGDIGKMLGDAGIVITPNGNKYIVVILANRPHNAVAGKDFIVHASEIIYKYMVK